MYFNALHAFFSLISLILSCALPAAPLFPALMNSLKWYCFDLILLCILNNLFFNSCQDGLNPWILDVNFPESNYHSIWLNVEAIENGFVLPIAWSRVSPHRKLTVAAVLGLRNVTGETFSAHFQQRLINKLPLWKGKCCVFLCLIMRASWMSGFVRAAVWVSESSVSQPRQVTSPSVHIRTIPLPVHQ